MTGEEIQRDIFNYRMHIEGSVFLDELPSVAQLNMLLYINPEKNYFNYTPEMAQRDIYLYYYYSQAIEKIRKNNKVERRKYEKV